MDSTQERLSTSRERRAQIVAAAVDLLADGGYDAVSMPAVATQAGLSEPDVLHHFVGTQDLLEQVVVAVLDEAQNYMRAKVEAAGSPPRRLHAYVHSNLTYLSEHPRQTHALRMILFALPPQHDGAPWYSAAGAEAVNSLAALLRAGQRTGDFGHFDCVIVARSMRVAIDAVTDLLRVDPDLDTVAYADELLTFFQSGVLAAAANSR